MKKITKIIAFASLAIGIITSCDKEKITNNEVKMPEISSVTDNSISPPLTSEQSSYMNSLQMYDKDALDKAFKKLSENPEKSTVEQGI